MAFTKRADMPGKNDRYGEPDDIVTTRQSHGDDPPQPVVKTQMSDATKTKTVSGRPTTKPRQKLPPGRSKSLDEYALQKTLTCTAVTSGGVTRSHAGFTKLWRSISRGAPKVLPSGGNSTAAMARGEKKFHKMLATIEGQPAEDGADTVAASRSLDRGGETKRSSLRKSKKKGCVFKVDGCRYRIGNLLLSDFPSPFGPNFCILLHHFNHCHFLFHHIHEPPFRPSPFPLSWQLHPQHPSPNIPIIFPPCVSIPPQSCHVFPLQTVPTMLSR